jgi:hypothetical protein
MKRQDVQVDVEYYATAPLAYGHEPRGHGRRVRFTDTRPGPWLRVIKAVYAENASYITSGPGWDTIETRIVHANSTEGRQIQAALPSSLHAALMDKYGRDEPRQSKTIGGSSREVTHRVVDNSLKAFGDVIEYVDGSIKGGLPGEVYRNGEWHTTLVQPADIHRTWAEVAAEGAERRAKERDLDNQARLPEIQALLTSIGLEGMFRVSRTGTGGTRVNVESLGRDGETFLAELTAWADAHVPAGKRRQRKSSKEAKS